jgi:uncharacterized membrane protein
MHLKEATSSVLLRDTPPDHVPVAPPAPARQRLAFLDGLRGVALILMVLNHTSRDWLEPASMNPGQYYLVYGSLLHPATIFLFLVGFCLPMSYRRHADAREDWLGLLVRYARRGSIVMAGGFLLNVLVFPEWPFWAGGVLQTIGLCIVLLAPLLPLGRMASVRAAVVVVAVSLYAGFSVAHPALVLWSKAHPFVADVLFRGFPPFPWTGAALLGLAAGWFWLDARARGDEERFFAIVAVVAVLSVAAYWAWQWWAPAPARFGFRRDFSLNGNWTPRGTTMFLILGGVAALLSGTYRAMQVRRHVPGWLVVLGQTALILYFVHQVIELTLVSRVLGWRFTHWWSYWAANVVFVALLVGLGKTWLAIKARVGRGAWIGVPRWTRSASSP